MGETLPPNSLMPPQTTDAYFQMALSNVKRVIHPYHQLLIVPVVEQLYRQMLLSVVNVVLICVLETKIQ